MVVRLVFITVALRTHASRWSLVVQTEKVRVVTGEVANNAKLAVVLLCQAGGGPLRLLPSVSQGAGLPRDFPR